MHNRACFWKPFGSERVNESQKLLKSAEKYLYPTFSSFLGTLSQKKLFLIRSDILGQLDNKYTGNYVYSRKLGRVYRYQFKSVYLRNAKPFAIFFEFFFMYIKFKMWWKKMSLIGQFFLKVLTPKMRWFKSFRGLVSESVWQWPC